MSIKNTMLKVGDSTLPIITVEGKAKIVTEYDRVKYTVSFSGRGKDTKQAKEEAQKLQDGFLKAYENLVESKCLVVEDATYKAKPSQPREYSEYCDTQRRSVKKGYEIEQTVTFISKNVKQVDSCLDTLSVIEGVWVNSEFTVSNAVELRKGLREKIEENARAQLEEHLQWFSNTSSDNYQLFAAGPLDDDSHRRDIYPAMLAMDACLETTQKRTRPLQVRSGKAEISDSQQFHFVHTKYKDKV